MSVKVLVVVEIHDASVEQCNDFDGAMAARQWGKLPRAGAVYRSTIKGAVSDADVLEIVQAHMRESAKAAGILLWDGVCVVSDSDPTPVGQPPVESTGAE